MDTHNRIELKGEELLLLKEKAVFWPSKRVLIMADLHFGKINHFRKSGIGVPTSAIQDNWRKFVDVIAKWEPKRVIILGDLFHSDLNIEWKGFAKIINSFEQIHFDLILGNHDIIDPAFYESIGIHVFKDLFVEEPFLMVHDEEDIPIDTEYYAICGHLHPGIKLSSPGISSLRLPCFHFNKKRVVLPAFGIFTGLSLINAGKNDQIHIISDEKVLKWQ